MWHSLAMGLFIRGSNGAGFVDNNLPAGVEPNPPVPAAEGVEMEVDEPVEAEQPSTAVRRDVRELDATPIASESNSKTPRKRKDEPASPKEAKKVVNSYNHNLNLGGFRHTVLLYLCDKLNITRSRVLEKKTKAQLITGILALKVSPSLENKLACPPNNVPINLQAQIPVIREDPSASSESATRG